MENPNIFRRALLTAMSLSLLLTLLIALPLNPAAVYAKPDGSSGSEIEISNGILTVYIESEKGFGIGSYTVSTGPNHPARNQNVFYGGSAGSAWSSYNTIVVNETKRIYVTTSNPYVIPDPEYNITYLDNCSPSISYEDRRATINWTINESLIITQDIEVLGFTIYDTCVRITMTIRNEGGQKYTVGIRYLWDIMIAENDGSWLKTVNPDSNWLRNEMDWFPPDFKYWMATDNPDNPTFTIHGSISEPSRLRIPATPPEGFMFAAWGGGSEPNPGLYDYAYSFSHSGRTIADSDLDSAVAYYWENEVDRGESWSVTAYLFTSPTLYPPPVGGFIISPNLSDLKGADDILGLNYSHILTTLTPLLLISVATIIATLPHISKRERGAEKRRVAPVNSPHQPIRHIHKNINIIKPAAGIFHSRSQPLETKLNIYNQ